MGQHPCDQIRSGRFQRTEFFQDLYRDCVHNKHGWVNLSIDDYLDAIQKYLQEHTEIADIIDWQDIAKVLCIPKYRKFNAETGDSIEWR